MMLGSSARRAGGFVQQREKLDDWCEKGILGLVMAILVYSPLAIGAVRLQEFVPVQWLTTGVLVLWVCRFWLNPKHRLLWPPVCWGVLAFMVYAVVRYLYADIEYIARLEMIKVLVYGFLFLAIVHNLYHLERIQIVSFILLCLAMVIAMYAVGQFLTESDHVWGFLRPAIYHKRGSGTFYCPNHLAGYLEVLLPLGLAYTLTSRLSHLSKILLGYATLAIFTGIVVSISLGGWISAALTVGIFFIWLMRWRDYRLPGMLVAIGLVLLATMFIMVAELSPNRLRHISAAMQADDIRVSYWASAIQMWKENFWFGAGPGHWDYRFAQYRPLEPFPAAMQMDPLRVHNDYLNTLADWGLVGAALVAAAWLLFYWGVFRSWRYVQRAQSDLAAKKSNKASFVMGGALGLLAILIHSVLDFNMHVPANALLVVAVMAMVTAHFRYATEKFWYTARWPMRLVATLVLLAGVWYLGWQSCRQTQESYRLYVANGISPESPKRVVALEKAFEAEPKNYDTAYRVGEEYRLASWSGGQNYRELAEKAMGWFGKSMDLNAFYPYSPMRYGMCLHWAGRHAEAGPYFERAVALDRNGFFTIAHMGWHYAQLGEWAKAKEWLQYSLYLQPPMNIEANKIATSYLAIANERLATAQNR